jgi:hypothetical protein
MSAPFVIAFDEAHKPRGKIGSNLTHLKEHLEKQGFICRPFMEFPITKQNLAPYDILVVACPDFSKFSKDEIEVIYNWVKNDGGGLIMLSHAGGDKGRRSNLAELAEKFGINFENDQVLDRTKNFGIENLPEIKNFNPPHPITEGIESICFRAGCSLTTFGAGAFPIAISNETSDPFNAPLIVVCEIENGHVIGCGSYEIFRDKISGGFDHEQHAQLATNMFTWLKSQYREELKQKSPQSFTLPVETSTTNQEKVGSILEFATDKNGISSGISSPILGNTLNIKSEITISDKSELAQLFRGLLNEVDILKSKIQTIIGAIISSEEKILGTPVQQTDIFASLPPVPNVIKSSVTVEDPTSSSPINSSNPQNIFGTIDNSPLSPLPPRPPTMLNKPFEQPNIQTSQETQPLSRPPPPRLPPVGKLEFTNAQEVFEDIAQEEFGSASNLQTAQENKQEMDIQQDFVQKMSLEDMKTEIDTLQSKLASIEDLRKLVENKFNNKKYSKDQYDKQMQRLENDKKRTLFRMEELANMIKKMT